MSKENKPTVQYSPEDHFRPAAQILFRETSSGSRPCERISALLSNGNTAMALRVLRQGKMDFPKHTP